jgi:hypothetical protein
MKKKTSVEVEEELFIRFREECIRTRFTFQKLADRAMFLFLNDNDFKEKIITQKNTKL